jgi:lysophospholipase L1-like esterase
MKCLFLLLVSATVWAQTALQPDAEGAVLGGKEAEQLATGMLQLVDSRARAIPGLNGASEPARQNARTTFIALQRSPLNAALTYQFINEVKAFLALSDSLPRPYPSPPAAEKQFSELRADLQRMERHFEAILQVQNLTAQKSDADPNDLKHYAEANTKLAAPGKLPRVIFLGDSITETWRLNEYFTGRDFINRGIGDQTTLQMIARFRQDVAALNPTVVVIEAGTNDIARGIAPNQIQDNLALMGDLAKAHGIKPVFASILPVSDYHKDADPQYEMTRTRPPATIQLINRGIRDYCQREGFVYLDYYAAMVDPAGQMQADLSDDGLHPNAKGYRVMSPIAVAAIGRVSGGQRQEEPADRLPKRRFRAISK